MWAIGTVVLALNFDPTFSVYRFTKKSRDLVWTLVMGIFIIHCFILFFASALGWLGDYIFPGGII